MNTRLTSTPNKSIKVKSWMNKEPEKKMVV